MKKLCVLFCLLFLCLSGCGESDLKIEDYVWQMTTLQSVESEGKILAFGPGETGMPDTAVAYSLFCEASTGVLFLYSASGDQDHSGSYRVTESNRQSVLYAVTVGETEGMAVVSKTTYHDGGESPTLILSLGDYAIQFAPATQPSDAAGS